MGKIFWIMGLAVLIACHSQPPAPSLAQPSSDINPLWATVDVMPIKKQLLQRTIRYGAYLLPQAVYPQVQPVQGMIRDIAVHVGDYVSVNTPLYSFQQIIPGGGYEVGWVYSQNKGIVAQINGVIGQLFDEQMSVVVIANFNLSELNLLVSNKDAAYLYTGMPVYPAAIVDELQELERQYKPKASQGVKQAYERQKAELQKRLKLNTGRISAVALNSDPIHGLFEVRVQFPATAKMKIGRFVPVEIRIEPYNGLAIPQSNVLRRYGQDMVTMVKEGKISYIPVQLGSVYGSNVAILDGLKEGDEIVVGSNRFYRLGDMVNVSK
jgi:multidrug efflux pump subunit AcrA (membrane-fusion protein)